MAGGIVVKEVDKGWNALMASIKVLREHKGSHVKVGVLDDGGDGSEERGDLTTASLAAVQEFGTEDGKIPARPFVSSTFETNKDRYIGDLALLLSRFYEGKIRFDQVFNIMGARMASDMRRTVTAGAGVPPPNAPSTVERKSKHNKKGGSGVVRTLIDTGRMVAAITWAVIIGGENAE